MSNSTQSSGTPAADFSIDAGLVQRLLREQHPDLAHLVVEHADTGWDNEIYRLGSDLSVRLPRRRAAIPLLVNEQRWLPELARRLPIAVPAPIRRGRPSPQYDCPWSVLPWLDGTPADLAPPLAGESERLAEFLSALHQPAPDDAPSNPLRGVPLANRADTICERMQRLTSVTQEIEQPVERLWQQALRAPPSTAPKWLHGDLHARNVLVDQGRISGVIDWGDITAGDVATDLSCIWMLLPDQESRVACLQNYSAAGAADSQIARAIGWAVFYGTILIDTGRVDCPRHVAMGRSVLRRLGEDATLFDFSSSF